jgi:hypothetical protein
MKSYAYRGDQKPFYQRKIESTTAQQWTARLHLAASGHSGSGEE